MTTNLHTLDAMITALSGAAYTVTFTAEPGAGVVASVSRLPGQLAAGYEHDAIGATPAEALAAALPESVEAYLAAMTPLPAPGAEDDARTLSGGMAAALERLDGAEDRIEALEKRGSTERALVHALLDVLADGNPDGELARSVKARRASRAAARAGGGRGRGGGGRGGRRGEGRRVSG